MKKHSLKLFTSADSALTKKTAALFIKIVKKDKRNVALFAFLIPFAQSLEIVIVPLLFSLVIQSLIVSPHDIVHVAWLLGGVAACALFSLISNHIGFIQMFRHEERATTELLTLGLNGALSHSQSYLANRKVGAIAGDVHTFSRAYMSVVDTIFMQLSGTLTSFVVSLVVVAFIAPALLLPLVLLTLFIVYHAIYAMNKRAVYRNERKELQSNLFGLVADVISNHSLVRLYGQKDTEITKTKHARGKIFKIFEKEVQIIQGEANLRRSVLYAFQILTIGLGVYLFSQSMLTISALVFTVTYLGRVTNSLFTLSSGIRSIEQAFMDAAKTTELLGASVDIVDAPHSKALVVRQATIDFEGVEFKYQDAQDTTVFSQLTFSIPAGQHVGLVGHSGGGKTTLTSLLLRYVDVTKGKIMIDNQNIAEVTQESLRAHMSYVPQDSSLFHRTLRENVAYGDPNATDEQISEAIRQANADEFINELPNGLDTVVGERGVKLSGGQRQRIAIARAILKDAPILVLDEATSALDSESEKLIQASLDTLMKGRTSIVIAHRLSTIAKLDRIIVLDHGKIVEDGTHAELLAKNGTYAKLWNHQSGGFIEE